MWDRVFRNAASNVAGTAISLAVGFVLMPMIVHHIGASQFGIWMLVNGLVGYMGLIDLGLAPTLVKKAAERLASDTPEAHTSLNRLVSTIFVIYVFLGVVAGAGLAVLATLPDGTFNVPQEDVRLFRTVLLIVGLQATLNFPMSVWSGLLGGLQDFHFANMLGVATNLLRVITTYWILDSGQGLVALVWMGFGISAFAWGARWWWVRRRIPYLKLSIRLFGREESAALVHFTGAMIIWSLAGYALHQMDKVLIGIVMPVALITTYEIGARINLYARNILHSWLSVMMPAASMLAARGDTTMLRDLYLGGTKYLLMSYGAIVVALLGFGGPFIRLWMGPGYAESQIILNILLLGSVFQTMNLVAHVMLPGMGRLRVFTRIMAGYAVATPLIGLVFTRTWGLPGMAAAITSTMILMESIFMPYIFREFTVRASSFVRECLMPTLGAAAAAVVWLFAANQFIPATTWPKLILDVTVCTILYLAAFWRVGLRSSERQALVARLFGGVRGQRMPAARAAPLPRASAED